MTEEITATCLGAWVGVGENTLEGRPQPVVVSSERSQTMAIPVFKGS